MKFRRRFGLRPRIAGLTVIVAAAALMVFWEVGASATGSSTGCPSLSGKVASTDVDAYFTDNGDGSATYSIDTPDKSATDGVPGLIKYCVFTSVPDTAVADYTDWDAAISTSDFAFSRTDGNPTNIPFDGTAGVDVGSATWSSGTVAADQMILLHINDATQCTNLYGGNPGTCWVLPTGTPSTSAADLSVKKTAVPKLTRAFTWTIGKAADKTSVTVNGTAATFNYTVTATPTAGTDGYGVTGTITVGNENGFDVSGVNVTDTLYPVAPADLIDTTDADGNCIVDGGADVTIPADSLSEFDYACTFSGIPGASVETNVALVTWPQTVSNDITLDANSTDAQVEVDWPSSPTLSDDCIDVTDSFYTTLTTGACVDANAHLLGTGTLSTGVTGTLNPNGGPYTSLSLRYSRTVQAPTLGTCASYDNTATFTTDDTATKTDSNKVTVNICNYNAALTIGYWGNHMANSARTGSWTDTACGKSLPSGTSCSSNGSWTKQFLGNSACSGANSCKVGELSDAHATTPITLGYSVTTIAAAGAVFNANNCSNASSSDSNAAACLAAQLLAAELNVGNTANPCSCSTIHNAITFLTNVGYKGPGQSVTFNGSYTRAYAISLKTALDNYNNNRGCPAS